MSFAKLNHKNYKRFSTNYSNIFHFSLVLIRTEFIEKSSYFFFFEEYTTVHKNRICIGEKKIIKTENVFSKNML